MKKYLKTILAVIVPLLMLAAGMAGAQVDVMERIRESKRLAAEAKAKNDAHNARVEKAVKEMEEGDAPPAEEGDSSSGSVEAPAETVDPEAGSHAQPAEAAEPKLPPAPPMAVSVPPLSSSAPAGEPSPDEETVGLPTIEKGALPVDMDKEVDDKGAKDLFSDPRFKAMLGENPRFVYDSVNVADPMIYPPVRNEAIKNELFMKADQLLKESGLNTKDPAKNPNFSKDLVQKTTETLLSVITITKDSRFTEEVNRKVREINLAATGVHPPKGTPTPSPVAPCELPEEVKANVRGIIASQTDPSCLIADYILKVGDTVPDYPNVKIISIAPGVITFEVSCEGNKTKTSEVTLKPNEEVGFFGGNLGGRRAKGGKGQAPARRH